MAIVFFRELFGLPGFLQILLILALLWVLGVVVGGNGFRPGRSGIVRVGILVGSMGYCILAVVLISLCLVNLGFGSDAAFLIWEKLCLVPEAFHSLFLAPLQV